MPGLPPAPVASPSIWSRISADTPPCTSPGGPSYAAPRWKLDQARPVLSRLTSNGGATALRRPTTVLPQCRPRLFTAYGPSSWRACSRATMLSSSAWIPATSASSISVRIVASTSSRTTSVNGP